MKTVLLNHVVSGAVRAEDLTDGMMAENLAGNMMTIRYFLDLGFTPSLFSTLVQPPIYLRTLLQTEAGGDRRGRKGRKDRLGAA